jgi:hypothetical protein
MAEEFYLFALVHGFFVPCWKQKIGVFVTKSSSSATVMVGSLVSVLFSANPVQTLASCV